MTFLGTRPEIIRLSLVIPALDALCDHILVHTGQNFDPRLRDIFFQELGVRNPDYDLDVRGSTFTEIIAHILMEGEKLIQAEKPDALLILGDTNSGLISIVAKRLGIPVYHMEAGNRCFDDRVPEEVNRRIIDHTSDILMPYTERSRANLLHEGIASNRIYVTGNPIKEVLDHYADQIQASTALEALNVKADNYFLITLHRAENVDQPERLAQFIDAFQKIHREYEMPVVCSLHPRTRSQLARQSQTIEQDGVRTFEPVGFFDFVSLEKNAFCVLSDSGTVQEECCIFQIPNVTIRDVTERPETIEVGSNILSGSAPENIMRCVKTALARPPDWTPPPEYLVTNASQTVTKIVLGYYH